MELGIPELLIIGVVLIVIVGTVLGLVWLVISLVRRREAPPGRPGPIVESDPDPREGRTDEGPAAQ